MVLLDVIDVQVAGHEGEVDVLVAGLGKEGGGLIVVKYQGMSVRVVLLSAAKVSSAQLPNMLAAYLRAAIGRASLGLVFALAALDAVLASELEGRGRHGESEGVGHDVVRNASLSSGSGL